MAVWGGVEASWKMTNHRRAESVLVSTPKQSKVFAPSEQNSSAREGERERARAEAIQRAQSSCPCCFLLARARWSEICARDSKIRARADQTSARGSWNLRARHENTCSNREICALDLWPKCDAIQVQLNIFQSQVTNWRQRQQPDTLAETNKNSKYLIARWRDQHNKLY